jgi:hypothetical protein
VENNVENVDAGALPWKIEDLDLDHICLSDIRNDETLFYVLAGASFVESGSDLYAHNLVTYYHSDPEVAGWLDSHWEPEELQHGRALRAYVEHVWPEFDWETAYKAFFEEYSKSCTIDEFEPSPALEMAARCIVETGTATLYGSIYNYTNEPVLKKLAGLIRADEVRHYKYFYRYFIRYNETERNGRFAVLGALSRRLMEIRQDDSEVALRHVLAVRHRDDAAGAPALKDISGRTRDMVRKNLPTDMSVKMFLKPLNFAPWTRLTIQYPLVRIAQFFFFR